MSVNPSSGRGVSINTSITRSTRTTRVNSLAPSTNNFKTKGTAANRFLHSMPGMPQKSSADDAKRPVANNRQQLEADKDKEKKNQDSAQVAKDAVKNSKVKNKDKKGDKKDISRIKELFSNLDELIRPNDPKSVAKDANLLTPEQAGFGKAGAGESAAKSGGAGPGLQASRTSGTGPMSGGVGGGGSGGGSGGAGSRPSADSSFNSQQAVSDAVQAGQVAGEADGAFGGEDTAPPSDDERGADFTSVPQY